MRRTACEPYGRTSSFPHSERRGFLGGRKKNKSSIRLRNFSHGKDYFGQDGYGKIASAIIAAIGILSVLLSGTYALYLLLR